MGDDFTTLLALLILLPAFAFANGFYWEAPTLDWPDLINTIIGYAVWLPVLAFNGAFIGFFNSPFGLVESVPLTLIFIFLGLSTGEAIFNKFKFVPFFESFVVLPIENNKARLYKVVLLTVVIWIVVIAGNVFFYRLYAISLNEAKAVELVRQIVQAERVYKIAHDNSEFGTLDDLVRTGHLDERFADAAPVSGYVFRINLIPKTEGQEATFHLYADPDIPDGLMATGKRHYYTEAGLGAIHYNNEKEASVTDASFLR